ncbi:Meprin A subunit beta [Orchesella cincta]|uniref:Metalloendopeptidase n=1 Tax=Orchesella cincta TaxID=48709 RepID=A0A1D2MBB6_ORCCI|nr:Meprin A subunit beta [Orchesella cincta]
MLGEYFEGDMRFAEGYDITSGVIGDRFRWPENTVPYTIAAAFTEDERNIILGALEEISNKTCIHFVPHSNQRDYVAIVRGLPDSGCWSFVGRVYGAQILNLQPGPGPHCIFHGIAAHEMIHALGFYHEQSRTDRDDYVTIMWDNVTPGKEGNFIKYSSAQVDPEGVAYDYGSIMHYGAYSFSQDASKPTIVPKTDVEIGQRNGLSESDVQKLRNMYKC